MNQLRNILQSKRFLLLLIIITCIYLFLNLKIFNQKSIYNLEDTSFIGTIKRIKITDYGYSLTLSQKEDLIVYTSEFNYNLGDTILVTGALELPENNTVFNNFNYKEYLKQNQIFYTIKADSIKLLKENTNILYKIKNSLLNYINKFKSKDYLNSFILGDTSFLEDNLYNSYQINGVCHLLSIGSTHVTLISSLFLFISKKLKVNTFVSNLMLFVTIFLLLIFTDYPISIVRVYLYLLLAFLNKTLKLNLKPIRLFIFTLLITLFINPFYIYNKGFLYSYSISFILILNKDKLTGNYLKKLIKISFISFLYSIPFNIYFNYSINLLSVFYNLFFVPIFNIVIFPLSLLTLVCPILDNLLYQVMEILNNISYILNNYTWGIIILKKISIFMLIFYLLLTTYVIYDTFNKKKKGMLMLTLVIIIHFYINDIIITNFFMTIDVGQGDSSLMYINNKSILIDTGGLYNSNVSEKTIIMLKSLGIRKIDYVILTHGGVWLRTRTI